MNTPPLSILYMGSGAFGLPSVEHLLSRKDVRLTVVTQPDRTAGRGKSAHPTPVAERLASTVPVKKIERVNDPKVVEELAGFQPDLLIVCDFGQILKPELLRIPKIGPFNLHASLLPAYRGAAPIRRAILDGGTVTGVTLLRVNERCDAGPILDQVRTDIGPEEDHGGLHQRLSLLAAKLLEKFLDACRTGNLPKESPQDERMATMAPKIAKEEYLLSFDQTATEVCRRVRAFSPAPGAFAFWNGRRVKILKAAVAVQERDPDGKTAEPGTVGADVGGRFLTISCAGFTLLLAEKIQLEGKRAMSAREVLNGRPDLVGSVLRRMP